MTGVLPPPLLLGANNIYRLALHPSEKINYTHPQKTLFWSCFLKIALLNLSSYTPKLRVVVWQYWSQASDLTRKNVKINHSASPTNCFRCAYEHIIILKNGHQCIVWIQYLDHMINIIYWNCKLYNGSNSGLYCNDKVSRVITDPPCYWSKRI